jgi:hypothetical protein
MRFCQPTKKLESRYLKWRSKLPKKVRKIAERFDIWALYRLKSTGDRVTIRSFANDGTVTVLVSAKYNLILSEREVFGIPADDLEECALPAADEVVGAALTTQQVAENLDAMRVLVRPDLWAMDESGKAVRKQ